MTVDAAQLPGPPPVLSDAEQARTDDGPHSGVPVLEPMPGGLAERFANRAGAENPVPVFLVAVLTGYALLVGAMILLGFALVELILPIPRFGRGRPGT